MSIERLAANYKIDQFGISIVRKSKTVFIVGIVSAGKDTMIKRLIESPDYHLVVTHTTRKPRVNNGVLEKDGVDYHFVSFDEMSELLKNHKMVEVNNFGGNYYGTSIAEIDNANKNNKIAISAIEVHGVSSFYDIAPNNTTAIFVVPPDYNTWIERIKNRYDSIETFENEWQTRREITINELEYVLGVPNYHFVINDNLDRAVKVADKIARHENDSFNRIDDEARLRARDLLDAIKQAS